jgi:hypothetical protein
MGARRLDIALAIGVMLASIALLGYWSYSYRQLRLFPPPQAARLLIGPERPSYPVDFVDRARKIIRLDPLNQRSLNLLYVYHVRSGLDDARTAELQETLARLGWRHTSAQQNLMYQLARTGRYAEAVQRIEALLLRQQLRDQALEALFLMEGQADTRPLVLNALKRDPKWLRDFFGHWRGTHSPERLTARLKTVQALQASGKRFSREELAGLIKGLAEAGQLPQAYAVWRSLDESRSSGILFDARFVHAARQQSEGTQALPFEWIADRIAGNGVAFAGSGNLIEAHLRWTGSGLPVFLRQRFPAVPGYYRLVLKGLDARPELLGKVRFSALCPGRTVRFSTPVSGATDSLQLRSDDPIDCRFPEFRIAGSEEWVGGSVDIAISEVQLSRMNN